MYEYIFCRGRYTALQDEDLGAKIDDIFYLLIWPFFYYHVTKWDIHWVFL